MNRTKYNKNWYRRVGKAKRLAKYALTKIECKFCKITFPMRRPKQVFCSKRCYGSFLSSICKSDSYPVIWKPEHPNSEKRGAIKKHRFVMSETLGRPLKKSEIVHHKNGNKKDCRPENEDSFYLLQDHMYEHSQKDRKIKKEKP